MKKKIRLAVVIISAALLAGCSLPISRDGQESPRNEQDNVTMQSSADEQDNVTMQSSADEQDNVAMQSSADEQDNVTMQSSTDGQDIGTIQNSGDEQQKPDAGTSAENESGSAAMETKSIEGFVLSDGQDVPVKVTFTLEGIERGEAAAQILAEETGSILQPQAGQEYIIFSFQVSYDEGGTDEIYMMEDRASMQAAGLYFALSNGDSNAEDVTNTLSNSIYDLTIGKGQSAHGQVAFLHRADATEPLYFVGFGNSIAFAFE